jgi:hypothetical protein
MTHDLTNWQRTVYDAVLWLDDTSSVNERSD